MKKMPVLFVGHGSPMNAIGTNPARVGWSEMGKELGKPQVIIAVSSHWMTKGCKVRCAADNPQVNDMYGFPQELYNVHYEPKGSEDFARKVLDCIGKDADIDNTWGIDHGIWSVLCNMYPQADVPVVMVSVDPDVSTQIQYGIGQRLKSLREYGAMIICSGNVVHNLRRVNWQMDDGYDWAKQFDKEIKELIFSRNFDGVINYKKLNNYDKSVPTTEHFLPLLTALGASDEEDTITIFNEYCELGSMSMTSYVFDK